MFIAIEGNAGTGKTTLARAIAHRTGLACVLEPGEEELSPLYKEMSDSSLRVQLYCFGYRLRLQDQIRLARSNDKGAISDFVLIKDRVYSEIWLQEKDFNAYLEVFNAVKSLAQLPDMLVFLDAPVDFLVQRIKGRNRDFEGFVDVDFIERLGKITKQQVLSLNYPNVLTLDATKFDIVSTPKDLDGILDQLHL